MFTRKHVSTSCPAHGVKSQKVIAKLIPSQRCLFCLGKEGAGIQGDTGKRGEGCVKGRAPFMTPNLQQSALNSPNAQGEWTHGGKGCRGSLRRGQTCAARANIAIRRGRGGGRSHSMRGEVTQHEEGFYSDGPRDGGVGDGSQPNQFSINKFMPQGGSSGQLCSITNKQVS